MTCSMSTRTKEEYEEAVKSHMSLPKSDRGDEPAKPPVRQFIIEDATIEAVGEVLRDNRRGLLVACDELDLWFQSMTRYGGKSGRCDRASWLKLHQGRGLILNRI